jgi:hypothetical protein
MVCGKGAKSIRGIAQWTTSRLGIRLAAAPPISFTYAEFDITIRKLTMQRV